MEKISKEEKNLIAKILKERSAILPCPRCGNSDFMIADGYVNNYIQVDKKNIQIGGPAIPAVLIICKNCGYISQHSMGILGLLK